MPKPLSSLAKHDVSCASGVHLMHGLINYAQKFTTQARARASARTKVRGKGQANLRAMGPGLRPELCLDIRTILGLCKQS